MGAFCSAENIEKICAPGTSDNGSSSSLDKLEKEKDAIKRQDYLIKSERDFQSIIQAKNTHLKQMDDMLSKMDIGSTDYIQLSEEKNKLLNSNPDELVNIFGKHTLN
jgi:hypothetical protein